MARLTTEKILVHLLLHLVKQALALVVDGLDSDHDHMGSVLGYHEFDRGITGVDSPGADFLCIHFDVLFSLCGTCREDGTVSDCVNNGSKVE